MKEVEIENLEIELLVEAIFRRYGYDFRHYSRASLKRRVKHFLSKTDFKKVSEAIPSLIYDRTLLEPLLYSISITVTEMFRDAFVYRAIRKKVIPFLKTYPFFKIWNAGCATGQEVYSIAIMLEEERIYDRSQIYATDFNDNALEKAKEGIYPVDHVKEYTKNYQHSGGKEAFSDYYHSQYDFVKMNKELRRNIVFANHNLASDSVFGEIHLIMCRNVLIYFDQQLQDHVLALFYDSLAHGGFLCLGTKESIRFSKVQGGFKVIDGKSKIYQKTE